jgi:hypothetical protein
LRATGALAATAFVAALAGQGCGLSVTGAAPLDLTTDGGGVDGGRQVDGSPAPASCESAKPIECGGVCVDLRSDPQHCGSCETSCPAGVCKLGQWGDGCTAGLSSC